MVLEAELDSDRRPKMQTGGDLFIKDGTIITLAGATHEKASIRIRGGKIEAIGADVNADGIEHVIDASGWFVSPGIIDCHSHIAIERGVNESTETISCQVRIGDVVDPHAVSIYRALAGGTTAAHLLHGSANVMGGQCQLIKLKYGRPVEELKVSDVPPTVKFALGENVKRSNSSSRGDRFPITRMGVEALANWRRKEGLPVEGPVDEFGDWYMWMFALKGAIRAWPFLWPHGYSDKLFAARDWYIHHRLVPDFLVREFFRVDHRRGFVVQVDVLVLVLLLHGDGEVLRREQVRDRPEHDEGQEHGAVDHRREREPRRALELVGHELGEGLLPAAEHLVRWHLVRWWRTQARGRDLDFAE